MSKLSLSKEIAEFEKIYSKEKIEILAVIGASGIGAGKIPQESLWTASIGIIAWKENICGSSLNEEKILLRFKATDEFLSEIRSKILKNSISRLVVRKNDTSFMLCDVLDYNNKDIELEEILKEELKPVFYKDDVFGEFNLDKSINAYDKNINWCGYDITISFDNNEENEIESVLKTGHALYRDKEQWLKGVCEFASDELLELKNDSWLDDNENTISKEEFIAALELCEIFFDTEGEFSFWFYDGELFFGHSIIVEGNIDGTFHSAYIAG